MNLNAAISKMLLKRAHGTGPNWVCDLNEPRHSINQPRYLFEVVNLIRRNAK